MKQFSLDFNKAITNVPSDFICSDNELDECVNITSENGEMKPIQSPIYAATGNAALSQQETCLFVHQMPETHNLITQASTNLYYRQKGVNDSTWVADSEWISGYTIDGQITGVQSVGNTLIVATTNGLNYFIWKGNGYTYLGSEIPFPEIEFRLWIGNDVYDARKNAITNYVNGEGREATLKPEKQQAWNDYVYGTYAMLKKQAKSKGYFTQTFLLRYAIELYDGTYTMHSTPIVMYPSFLINFNLMTTDLIERGSYRMTLYTASLQYYIKSVSFSNWSDIVKGITLFISDEIENYILSQDARFDICAIGEQLPILRSATAFNNLSKMQTTTETEQASIEEIGMHVKTMTPYTEDAFMEKVKDTSIFYKAAKIPTDVTQTWKTLKISPEVLENITTQQQMGDEFHSHDKISAGFIYAYNSRINLTQASRKLFNGFSFFSAHDDDTSDSYTIQVHINTDSGEKIVQKTVANTNNRLWDYFYYPDTRATKAVIIPNGGTAYTINLEEHSGLNGAVAVNSPLSAITRNGGTSSSISNTESLPNQVITSEVNNPFVFKAEGYNAIGTGRIIGIATQTTALSQGQFGQFPLLVFSSDGIWAMSVNSTGLYQSVHPMSREVCTHNESITETDGAVFFVSEKGLMVVQGSQVQCVSKQLNGRIFNKEILPVDLQSQILYNDFEAFLAACKIAYDYRDSLLWIINPSQSFAYIYNMKSGTFSKKTFRDNPQRVVSNYPDYLIQTSPQQGNESYLFSLLHKPDQNDDPSLYGARMLTRPVTFGNILELKSISQMMNIKPFFSQNANLTTRLFASNNFKDWCELHSLRGIPWKAYRIYYDFTDLKATDRFAGTTFITESHRTNKIR